MEIIKGGRSFIRKQVNVICEKVDSLETEIKIGKPIEKYQFESLLKNLENTTTRLSCLDDNSRETSFSEALNDVLEGEYQETQSYRRIGWIFRFAFNSRKTAVEILGELTFEEIDTAEIRLLKSIQLETFGSNPNHLKNLQITEDKNGLWRIITKLTEGEDSYNFKYPILIPGEEVQEEEIQENQQQESNTAQEDDITEKARGNKEGMGSIDDHRYQSR
ncbi:hypothetical protein JTB14_021456 [Gonioctena quinquepunctata]|nr:hypothetical protein JTB14_021456 [Gonioctena quinquepunctata]